MEKFELRLMENEKRGNKGGYFVGDSMTIADLKFYTAIKFALSLNFLTEENVVQPYPKVSVLMANMRGDDGLKRFEATFKAQTDKKNVAKHVVEGKNVYLKI